MLMKHLLSSIVLFALMTTLNGQGRGMNAISTAGGSIETKGLVVSWTIGEDLIDFTLMDASMRQPSDYNPSILEMKDGTQLKVYPTLTKGLLTVEIRRSEPSELKVEILDLKGSKLKEIDLEADKLTLDLSDYIQGGYYLKISNISIPDMVTVRITKV